MEFNIDILLNLKSKSYDLKYTHVNIIPVIRELLLRNQKAIVPGFGAFVLSQRPAQLNRTTGVLTPPTVTVKFDSSQQADDGQLTGYLTRKLGLDKEVALTAVKEFRSEVEEKLGNNLPFTMEGFGVLSKKANGAITFAGEEELLKRVSIFKMPQLEVPRQTAVKQEKPEPVKPEPVKPEPVKPEPVRPEPVKPGVNIEKPVTARIPEPAVLVKEKEYKSNRKWIIPVVLFGLLIGMLAVIYITGNMGTLISDVRSIFNPEAQDSTGQLVFGNTVTETSQQGDSLTTQISRELDDQVDRGKALSIEEPKTREADEAIQPVAQPKVQEVTNYARPYHIVAGSFTILENAEKQRSTLQAKGLSAEILPKKGKYYMVSMGSFDTPEEAASQRDQLRKTAGIDLWVMKNN